MSSQPRELCCLRREPQALPSSPCHISRGWSPAGARCARAKLLSAGVQLARRATRPLHPLVVVVPPSYPQREVSEPHELSGSAARQTRPAQVYLVSSGSSSLFFLQLQPQHSARGGRARAGRCTPLTATRPSICLHDNLAARGATRANTCCLEERALDNSQHASGKVGGMPAGALK